MNDDNNIEEEFELDFCPNCMAMKNHIDGICQNCNCCKQCKEPIEKGFRFCSGECKQYYYR